MRVQKAIKVWRYRRLSGSCTVNSSVLIGKNDQWGQRIDKKTGRMDTHKLVVHNTTFRVCAVTTAQTVRHIVETVEPVLIF